MKKIIVVTGASSGFGRMAAQGLAAVAHMMTGTLMPSMGMLALPLVVFFVAILVVGLRSTSIVNNMLA